MTNAEIKLKLKSKSVNDLYNEFKDSENFLLVESENPQNLNLGKVVFEFYGCNVVFENNNLTTLIYKNI